MEGAGPPPADSERIETLPKVIITQELVGEYSLSLNEFYYRLSIYFFIQSNLYMHIMVTPRREGGGYCHIWAI